MFTYSVYYQQKGSLAWTQLNGQVARPFSLTDTLDETLESGRIKITGLSTKPDIRPFTMIQIDTYQQSSGEHYTRYYRAGSVKTVKRRYQENAYLYDTQIDLIELTKELERVECDTMTCTNYLGKNYLTNNGNVIPVVERTGDGDVYGDPYESGNNYLRGYATNEGFTVYGTQHILTCDQPTVFYEYATVEVKNLSNETLYTKTVNDSGLVPLNVPEMEDGNITLPLDGVYKIIYTGKCYYGGSIWNYTVTYNISAISNIAPKTDWTITSVVNRLLTAGKTRRNGIESRKYYFPTYYANKYSAVKAPEFYFSRQTLKEALLTVGGAIHAIPRLTMEYNDLSPNRASDIIFTPLGGNEVKTITEPLMYEEREWNEADYCGAFDSTVENMVNTIDRVQGAVIEPSATAFKTVRCAPSETRINADTMSILTDFPINQITGLWISAIIDGTQYTGDISAYVFEKAEYDALSSYTGAAFPYSKAYALCYQQGSNQITGLNFHITGTSQIASAFQEFAIYNIIEQVFQIDLTNADMDYISLGFRVQYIPIVTARVKQLRPTTEIKPHNELIYNQGGNSVESSFYGEKLRGAAARLGNETVTRTYAFSNYSDIPEVGNLVDVDGVKMYVAVINMLFDTNYIRVTMVMTPNYNKLSEYVGINSNYRLYDVSEKQSVERLMNYGETCVIGTAEVDGLANMHPLINDWGIKHIKHTFTQTTESNLKRPRCAELSALNADGAVGSTPISHVTLPLSSGGLGNSLYFNFKYLDNYGAGYQALSVPGGISIDRKNNRILRNVPYGDVYGEVRTLAVKLNSIAGLGLAEEQTAYNGGANTLPEAGYIISTGNSTFNTGDVDLTTMTYPNTFEVQKDSREQLNITLQQHFQTTTPDIVVGKALTQDNLLITDRNTAKAGVLYLLPEPLNILRQKLDLTDALNTGISVADLITTGTNKVVISSFTAPVEAATTYKAWAIVNPTDNTFYIGKNEDLTAGDSSSALFMCFTDNTYFNGYTE